MFGFAGNPLQSVTAILGAQVERLIAEAPGLIARSLPTFPKAAYALRDHFAHHALGDQCRELSGLFSVIGYLLN